MAKLLDKILVIDVESTCWEGGPPPGEVSEIIEIGITEVLLPQFKIGKSTQIWVKPAESKVSKFCTELTGITQDYLDSYGLSFPTVCNTLSHDYQTKDRVWASFGDYDREQFRKQCNRTHVPYPFGKTHINVKNLFAIRHGLDKELGMPGVLKILKMELVGLHHCGLDDSYNIARILVKELGNEKKI